VTSESVVRVYEERSRSRSGLHRRRRLYFILDGSCRRVDAEVIDRRSINALYSKGEAWEILIKVDTGFIVQLDFVRNPRGIIKGNISILNKYGVVIAKGVYRKFKVRLTYAISKSLIDIIKCVFRELKLPVKRYAVIKP